jgi:hypothetical protein
MGVRVSISPFRRLGGGLLLELSADYTRWREELPARTWAAVAGADAVAPRAGFVSGCVAAIVLLQPKLDDNYRAVKKATFDWGMVAKT